MPGQIDPGQTGLAADFINNSERNATPANDEGRVPKLETNGRLHINFALPAGAVFDWPKDTPPDGTLACNGQAVSRTTYAQLFAVLGTDYGAGDGSTTFNIPNYKGRVRIHLDTSQAEFDTMGEPSGAKTHVHGATLNGTLPTGAYANLGDENQPVPTAGQGISVSGTTGAGSSLQPGMTVLTVIVY